MIRKLRTRLVLASMLSLIAVLGVIMGGLNLMNYQRIVRDSDGVLALLGENGGRFPRIDDNYKWPERGPRYRSRELPFEMRYFSVLLDGDGNVLDTRTDRIAAVGAEAARDYARAVFESGGTKGFQGIYRYLRRDEAEGVRIIFLDCGIGCEIRFAIIAVEHLFAGVKFNIGSAIGTNEHYSPPSLNKHKAAPDRNWEPLRIIKPTYRIC